MLRTGSEHLASDAESRAPEVAEPTELAELAELAQLAELHSPLQLLDESRRMRTPPPVRGRAANRASRPSG